MAWIIHSGVEADEWAPDPSQEIKWFIFLTNWAYFTLTTSTLVDATVVVFIRLKRRDIIKGIVSISKSPACFTLSTSKLVDASVVVY